MVRTHSACEGGVTLFVAAEPRECEPWIAHWSDVRPAELPVHWARTGKWKGAEVMAIANGAGPQRAHSAVLAAAKPDAVVSIGFCGALDSSLAIGDVFVASEIRDGGRAYRAENPLGPESKIGPLASQTRIAQSAAEKRALRTTGAYAVEMEAAGVVRASEELSVPFYCVKAVSDLADEDFANDFNACLLPNGRMNIPRLVLRACANPAARFGELIRLAKRTALASNNLGEFLAHCNF
jgi:hypothetical protein